MATHNTDFTPRLIAVDMDGTLLDPAGQIPEDFWPLLARARERGVTIAPASGRQLATLERLFARDTPAAFIAENGAVVARGGEIVAATALPEAPVRRLLTRLPDAPCTAHAVVCAPTVAHTLSSLPPAVDKEVDKYYASRASTPSLLSAPLHHTVKIALYVEEHAESKFLPWVRDVAPELVAVLSGEHWVDLMHPEANKGRALAALAASLSVDMADTAAFGDYLNDYALLEAAGHGVAMGNAHEDLKGIADEVIGTNGDHAVVDKLRLWLDD